LFLILGLVMLIFGEDWRVFGIPARPLGGVIVGVGIVESYFWTWRARAQRRQLARAYEAAYREHEAVPEPDFVRHVVLSPDGQGATFYMSRDSDGNVHWSYDLDPKVGPVHYDLNPLLIGRLEQAIYQMERKLGLPEGPGTNPWAKRDPPKTLPGWPWEDVPDPPKLSD
jgi:hypothetical protein